MELSGLRAQCGKMVFVKQRDRRGMHQTKYTVSLVCALLCCLTACAPVTEVSSRHPDEFLFDRAMGAVQQDRYDVARLTLETLVNTYPDSPYTSKANAALHDPRIVNCGDSWTTTPGCDSKPETMGPR